MKKFIPVLKASILIGYALLTQSSGDCRSIGGGNWNDQTEWETYNVSSWITASTYLDLDYETWSVTIINNI